MRAILMGHDLACNQQSCRQQGPGQPSTWCREQGKLAQFRPQHSEYAAVLLSRLTIYNSNGLQTFVTLS